MLAFHTFFLKWQVRNDADVINAALKQVARLEQLAKHQSADHLLTLSTSPVTSGTADLHQVHS